MGFHIPLWKNKKLYVRNPFKVVHDNSMRLIEDSREMVDVFGKPNVVMFETNHTNTIPPSNITTSACKFPSLDFDVRNGTSSRN